MSGVFVKALPYSQSLQTRTAPDSRPIAPRQYARLKAGLFALGCRLHGAGNTQKLFLQS